MGSTAKIIDLAAYRQRRARAVSPARSAMVLFVPVWAFVPIFVVSGYF